MHSKKAKVVVTVVVTAGLTALLAFGYIRVFSSRFSERRVKNAR